MRVALLHHGYGGSGEERATARVRTLAAALEAAGHEPLVIASRAGRTRRGEDAGVPVVRLARLPDGRLRSRGFPSPLTHLPALLMHLRATRYDAVHAFSPEDAALAVRAIGRVAFTPPEPPHRGLLADRRLRAGFWDAATRPPSVVVVGDEAEAQAVSRWLAVDPVIARAGDPVAHENVYRGLS